ncbi:MULTISPECIES: glycosyltransferase family 2 protein [unclassified Halomonas]|uniref:glycosyltransferase family 2 protein n=1 Tax=unclassified Halomonas TaxID=2609666 RepID=UPI002885B409|nr:MULTISPECIES: glycosyltransferase family 2 protein [unclassified Halomonas]MDT0500404.1 glycosyltransferase family 2 protein [Halomonas sp. PAR7]MDT0590013.1 glycosyltransferase family 2 protein [Halomonas sp. PAR8]
MKLAVAAIVKNEKDCLPEWLAYHRLVGACHFLIADNGSSDGTRELLAARDDVTLLDVPTEGKVPPQLEAYERLLAACPSWIEVLAFIDADEFLVPMDAAEPVAVGTQRVPSLLPWLERRFADESVGAVVLNWACFGSSGEVFREPGLVIERFTRRAAQAFGPNRHYKSLVRPQWVSGFDNPHHVRLSRGRHVDARGEPLQLRTDREGLERSGLSEEVVWEGARINHYIVKSVEEFLAGKARRGSASRAEYVKGRSYFERHDRNDECCERAAALAPRLEAALAAPSIDVSVQARSEAAIEWPFSLVRRLGRRVLDTMGSSHDAPPFRWALDYPSEQRAPWYLPSGRVVQGWVLLPSELAPSASRARVVARWLPEHELCHPLEIARPDVIEAVLGVNPDAHPQRRCGFRFTVPPRLAHFHLELVLDERRWPLQEVRCQPPEADDAGPLKVVEGHEGWLFLDNDTNASVDQYRGRVRLTDRGLAGWQAYLSGLARLASEIETPWSMLVAPAKETVMGPRYHPETQGACQPIDQLLALPESLGIVHPVSALQALGDDAFIRTDTHWTQRGAMTATVELAASLGLNRDAVMQAFADDRYVSRAMGGDLGNKLTPRQTCDVEMLRSFSYIRYRVYDNGLPNFGRLLVIAYPEALIEGTCLVFGSSSTNSMFHFLSRLFRRVIFIHSAGNLDREVVAATGPDYLVVQTNARFLVQVPVLEQSLAGMIENKIARLDDAELSRIEERAIDAAASDLEAWGLARWQRLASERLVARRKA